LFTRFLYFGKVQLGFDIEEVWLTPFGLLLDMITCHKQFLGIEKPKREYSLDDVLPV